MALDPADWVEAEAAGSDGGSPATVSTTAPHGFVHGEEIKVFGLNTDKAVYGSFYVGIVDSRQFELYLDEQCSSPLTVPSSKSLWVRRPRSEDYAIVVGINRYQGFKQLGGAEADAQAFHQWLLSGEGGCLPAGHVKRIPASVTDKPPVYRPKFSEVHDAFVPYSEKVLAPTGRRRIGRRLYIFLAGHGITPTRAASPMMDDAALLMADATGWNMPHVSGLGYAEWFRNAGAFDEIVLFADCCRTEENNIVPNLPTFPVLHKRRNHTRVFYASATGFGSSAWERDLGVPAAPRGIFSFVLMQALAQGAARDDKGRLTAGALKNYIRNEVKLLTSEQSPQFVHVADPDIVLFDWPIREPPKVTFCFSGRYQGMTIRLIGSKYPEQDHELKVGPEPIKLPMPQGLYKMRADGSSSQFFEIDERREQHVEFF